ncbi:MAG TPA: hypothetical protein VGF30_05795 [Bacteroidia bacterium]
MVIFAEVSIKRFIILAVVIHILAAWFSVGRYHADEQFQVLEFAAYKTGVNPAEVLPWEFHEKIRPTVQVAFAYGVMEFSDMIGVSNPFIQAFIMRLLFSLLGLYASILLLKRSVSFLKRNNYWFLCMLTLFWCFIPWFHARFSSENVGMSFFLMGFIAFLDLKGLRNEKLNITSGRYFLLFLLVGLAGVIRFQLNFFTIGLLFWLLFIKRVEIKNLIPSGFGIVVANGLGILCDKWFYGKWEFTTWNYFYQNLVLHKAEQFGKEPFYYYFEKTLSDAFPPFSILIILSVLYFIVVFRRSSLTWILVPFLLAHFFTAHKELRFLFPLIPIIPFIAVVSYQKFQETRSGSAPGLRIRKTVKILKYPFYISNFLFLLYLSFKPADDYTPTLKFLYSYTDQPTVLYYEKEEFNPYSNAIALNFYRSKSVEVKMNNEEEMTNRAEKKESTLFITDVAQPVFKKGVQTALVYSTLPLWLKPFNFNNWQERVHPLYIYKVYL